MAEAGHLFATGTDLGGELLRYPVGVTALLDAAAALDQDASAEFSGAKDDRAAAEDACGDRTLKAVGRGGKRHTGRLRRRRQAVLGDRDQQRIEEEALLLAGVLPGDQEEKVVGEALAAHQVVAEVAAMHLDAGRIGRADAGNGLSGLADHHADALASCRQGAVIRRDDVRTVDARLDDVFIAILLPKAIGL